MAITVQELINNPKYQDQKCLVLLNKPIVEQQDHPRKHKKHKKSRLDRMEEKLDLILKRLDYHEQLFRAHGWIK